MGFFNLFKKKTSLALTEDLDLMTWLDPFYHRQVTYIRKSHALQELVHFHAGDQSVWGYTTTPLPKPETGWVYDL